MAFSRAHPSARYFELLRMNKLLHEQGEIQTGLQPEKTFEGMSLLPHLKTIKALIERTGATTLLDYGCGKGHQYDPRPIKIKGVLYKSIIDYWGVAMLSGYDPCYPPYSQLPEGKFDGVISTDVLEHCSEQDLPWIMAEIFDCARLFVYVSIALYPATKLLPNGENAHSTLKPRKWWEELLRNAAASHPKVLWEACLESKVMTVKGPRIRGTLIGSGR
jgi:hypothetical protein